MGTLTFLGTSDSKGVPRLWCSCPVCAEARTTGANRRTRTALLLEGEGATALLDAGPDLHGQLARRPCSSVPSAVFISHAHSDHILGLADLFGLKGCGAEALRIYAPAEVIPELASRFSYAFQKGAPVQPLPDEGIRVAGVTVRAFRVPHGANGHSHAFRLDRPGWAGVVMTDALHVPDELAARWLSRLDLLVLGTAYVDEQAQALTGRGVYDIGEALALPWARSAGRVYLTHLSHGVDARRVELPPDWCLAHDGLRVPLKSPAQGRANLG